MRKVKKIRQGVASFYIVAISTLILVIIAASFAAVVISEIARTSNDDLAQSAYDSALAGIEDAKLAYYNYQNCKRGAEYSDSGISCSEVISWVENATGDCDMVAKILGRGWSDENGVPVQEGETNNDMQQYYTCVKITNKTGDVLGTISESSPEYVVEAKFNEGIHAKDIKKIKVKWHSDSDDEGSTLVSANYGGNGGLFETSAPMPAVLEVSMIQTGSTFNLSDFDMTQGNTANRGTVYLVPYLGGLSGPSLHQENDKFEYVYRGGSEKNYIYSDGFLKSNDKMPNDKPYLVKCNIGDEYACVAEIDLPGPVGGERSDENFIFKIALPYGGPSTSFSLEFYCGDGVPCSTVENSDGDQESSNLAILKNVQISIDSTGKADDLYRRVEARFELAGSGSNTYPTYAVQLFGNDNNESNIRKNFYTTSEYNFN